MAQCQCGTSNADDARFCSSCGDALGEESRLLGVSTTVTEVTTVDGLDRRWVVIAAAVFAAVIGWSIVSGGSSDTPLADDLGETAGTTTSTTVASTTTTVGPTTTERRTTTTGGEGPTVRIIGDGKPLLGEMTGLRLIIGRTSYPPAVLELDTGHFVTPSRGPNNYLPLMVSGDWLVTRNNNRLFALSTSDLGAEPIELLAGDDSEWLDLAGSAPRTDGKVWILAYRGSPSLVLVDLATGQALETIEEVDPYLGTRAIAGSTPQVPTLLDHTAGGIYRIDGDRSVQVADGRLVIADADRVLIETCDELLLCRQRWFDRRTWEAIDLALPPTEASFMAFVNGSDWIALNYYFSQSSSVELFNVATATLYQLDFGEFDAFGGNQPAVSPDGRWLGRGMGQDLIVQNLDSGDEWRIEGTFGYSNSMLFTTAEVGYAAAAEDGGE